MIKKIDRYSKGCATENQSYGSALKNLPWFIASVTKFY